MAYKWTNSEKTVALPVGFCRDPYIFNTETSSQNTKQLKNELVWWIPNDGRFFLIPVDFVNYFPVNNNVFRDTIACISQLYIASGFPENKVIETSLRQLTDNMGLAFNGNRAEEIDRILSFASFYKIKQQRLHKIDKGKVIEYESEFSFLQAVDKVVAIDGVPVNLKTAKKEIMLSDKYADILKNGRLPKAPVPVLALEIANNSPRPLITPMKNFVYNLAALIPRENPSYSLETLKKITGYKQTRKDRLRKSLENLFDYLTPNIIKYNYDKEKEKYIFEYAGELLPKSETQHATK